MSYQDGINYKQQVDSPTYHHPFLVPPSKPTNDLRRVDTYSDFKLAIPDDTSVDRDG